MKKSFYFALALTAGLFASCSSDDLTADAPQQSVEIDDSAPALIKLNIGSPNGTTRGTGSVGWEGNKWEGQSFNIFMFEKGTLDLGYETVDDVTGEPIYIFDNTELVTSANADNADQADANFYVVNQETQATEIQFNYFPSNGKSYSFWAYRVDDANPGGAYKYTDDNGTEVEGDARTQVRVPFEIDGSQDIMIAETPDEETVAGTLVAKDATLGKTLSLDDAKAKIYSAYSARREINPQLEFSHKLTRLYFFVKAASKDVSKSATNKTTMWTDANGLDWYPGYKVTGVSVRSKSKGEVIAAYKGDIPENAKRVVWTDATQQWSNPASLAELQLRSRVTDDADPDFIWYEIDNPAAYTAELDLDADGVAEGYYYLDSRTIPFNDADAKADFMVYPNRNTNDDGEPTAEPVKWSELEDLTQPVYLALTPMGNRDSGEPWTKKVQTYSVSENLSDQLDPVTPKWNAIDDEDAGWNEIDPEVTANGYTWTERAAADLTEDQIENAVAIAGSAAITAAITDGSYKPDDVELVAADEEAGTSGTIIAVTRGATKYYELTAIAYNTDGVEEVDALPEEAANNKIVKLTTNGKFYKFTAADENAGEGEPTLVGEALLVAPEDEGYGYKVTFNFSRCKKLTGTSWVQQSGSSTIDVKLKQAAGFDPATAEEGTANAFQPGKAYKVTAVIYSDGEIKTENVTIINWDSDTAGEMENEGVVDMN